MRHTVGKGSKARGRARMVRAEALGEEMAQRLTPPRPYHICYEEYGPDGEIERVSGDRSRATTVYEVTCTDYAPPKTDWRERGVVPMTGKQWREQQERRHTAEAKRRREAAEKGETAVECGSVESGE